jgi:hypothetical protein
MTIDIDKLTEAELIALDHRIVAKYKRKTVSVSAENGRQWRVAPAFLRTAEPAAGPGPASAQVIGLPRK